MDENSGKETKEGKIMVVYKTTHDTEITNMN